MKIAIIANIQPETHTAEEKEIYYSQSDINEFTADIPFETRVFNANSLSFMGYLIPYQPDLVFNLAERISSGTDREAHVPAIIEICGFKRVGSGILSTALALDKRMTKRVLHGAGLPTPIDYTQTNKIQFPVIVKPRYAGSSMEIDEFSVIHSYAELHEINLTDHIIEEFLPGKEYTIGIIGNKVHIILPIMQIDTSNALTKGVFSASDKLLPINDPQAPKLIIPPPISPKETMRLAKLALSAKQALNIDDFCRVDIREDQDGMYNIIEVNPIPGITSDSDMYRQARAAKLSHSQFLYLIISAAIERYDNKPLPIPPNKQLLLL